MKLTEEQQKLINYGSQESWNMQRPYGYVPLLEEWVYDAILLERMGLVELKFIKEHRDRTQPMMRVL